LDDRGSFERTSVSGARPALQRKSLNRFARAAVRFASARA
jgi:hypothetical protein